MVGVFCVIQEERGGRTNIENNHIDVAVVIDVAEGDAAPRLHGTIVESGRAGDFVEGPVTPVSVQENGLVVLDALYGVDVGINMAARHEEIGQAAVIKVDETSAPTN